MQRRVSSDDLQVHKHTMSQKALEKLFPIKNFVSDLSTPLLQSAASQNGTSGRLVVVGDVHGMHKSLQALLEKVDFSKQNGDHLILVGDLVNKGPDSSSVIDLAMRLGASAVRGNHDNAVLKAATEIKAREENPSQGSRGDTLPENSEATSSGETVQDPNNADKPASSPKYETASSLSTTQLDWLAELPLILRVKLPRYPSSTLGDSLIIVHAGLAPGIPLEDQDPHAVMHMRSLVHPPGDETSLTPAEAPGDESWIGEWDKWQEGLPSKSTVIFGHDAKRRLQLGKYTIGIDSGCLYGNQLSAVVIAASGNGIEHQIVQVECADAHLVV